MRALWIALLGASVAACGEPKGLPPPETPAAQPAREQRAELHRRALERKSLERFAGEAPPSSSVGEVPEALLSRVLDDLENRTEGLRSDFTLLRAESVRWSDGSLGCAEPGRSYEQMPVDGFRVVISYQGAAYDYRLSEEGLLVLCRDPRLER